MAQLISGDINNMSEITQQMLDDALAKQKSDLEALFESETQGLKSTLAAMKQEKTEGIEKERLKVIEAEQAAIDAAKEKGDLQAAFELEKAKDERLLNEYKEKLTSKTDLILSGKKTNAVNDIVSKFVKQDKLSRLTASQLVDFSMGDDDLIVANYKNLDGEVVANNFDDWQAFAEKDPDMREHLAGSKSSISSVGREALRIYLPLRSPFFPQADDALMQLFFSESK